jgi:predicted 3-demethylubiquinone-9 3-methyltransferase (glyoxalase superfamily)
MQKITPWIIINDRVEEAMNFYVSVFKNARIVDVWRMGEGQPVLTASLELDGERLNLLNMGPKVEPNAAVSFFINCQTQAEVDELWDKLTADGGSPIQCGWLKDKFGVHWQVIPEALMRLNRDKDPAKSQRVMQAMMKMVKIDIAGLERAYAGD